MDSDRYRRQGYTDGLLGKPFAYAGPEYREGYAHGATDRVHFGLRDSWCGDSNKAIDKAVHPGPG